MDSSGSGRAQLVIPCEHCNEPSSSIKGRESLGQLTSYYLLQKTVPWGVLVNLVS
jgi:hypothetical protein